MIPLAFSPRREEDGINNGRSDEEGEKEEETKNTMLRELLHQQPQLPSFPLDTIHEREEDCRSVEIFPAKSRPSSFVSFCLLRASPVQFLLRCVKSAKEGGIAPSVRLCFIRILALHSAIDCYDSIW